MRMVDLIEKKKLGMELSDAEIAWMIDGYVKGDIPDYQMSAMLMAICFQGMTERETVTLTLCMRDSGDVIDLSAIPGVKADKHSTGGVGDKTTLIVAPVAAACGARIAKMSGRGLGHTGARSISWSRSPDSGPDWTGRNSSGLSRRLVLRWWDRPGTWFPRTRSSMRCGMSPPQWAAFR